jgi:hypothetical protein
MTKRKKYTKEYKMANAVKADKQFYDFLYFN